MKTASLKELKLELGHLSKGELLAVCLRLAKFKKENKELLTYLLFDAADEAEFVSSVKAVIEEQFLQMNTSNIYFVRKSTRKVIRLINRYTRYSNEPTTLIEVLLFMLQKVNALSVDWRSSQVMLNIYFGLQKKISKEISLLHEDLQYDFKKELNNILND